MNSTRMSTRFRNAHPIEWETEARPHVQTFVLSQAAQLAWDEVHNAAHAKHTEYMMFLKSILTDFGDIWRSLNEPKKLLASWTSQFKSLTCTLEAIARDAAAHNCRSASDCRVTSVAQPASIEKLSDTSSSLVRKINRTCENEAQFSCSWINLHL